MTTQFMNLQKTFILILVAWCTLLNANAQSGFEKTYGGAKDDEAFYIQKTGDGGYIITGSTSSTPAKEQDIYILKIDSKGNVAINSSLGWPNDDKGNCIQPTADGGYIIAGSTQYSLDPKYYNNIHVKTNGTLTNIPWANFVLGQTNGNHAFNCVQLTNDGNFILTGTYEQNFLTAITMLTKINAKTGDTIWTKFSKYRADHWQDKGNSVIQTSDKGYLVGGQTLIILGNDMNDHQATLMKTDSMGNIKWHKEYGTSKGSSMNDFDIQDCKEVIQGSDGGFVLVGGSVQVNNGTVLPSTVYIVKTNSNGDTIWTKRIKEGFNAGGNSIKQTADGGYIVVGYTEINKEDKDVLLLRVDANGKKLWSKSFGGTKYDCGNSIQLTSEGGFILAGVTESKGLGGKDVYIIKTGADGTTAVEKLEKNQASFLIAPNPSKGKFTVHLSDMETKGEIKIFDLSGRIVYTNLIMDSSADIDLTSYRDGIYIVKLYSEGHTTVRKVVLQR